MRFLGLFVLFAALYITWGLFNGNNVVVSESVHVQIQKNLVKKIIQEVIVSNPKAYNIEVSEFWTETIDEKNIVAYFKFQFEEKGLEEDLKVTKNGQIRLSKAKQIKGVEQWEVKGASLKGQKIDFKKGLTFFKKEMK